MEVPDGPPRAYNLAGISHFNVSRLMISGRFEEEVFLGAPNENTVINKENTDEKTGYWVCN